MSSAHDNGIIVMKVLEELRKPASLTTITNEIAKVSNLPAKSVRPSVQKALTGGVRYGFIYCLNDKYFLKPVGLPGNKKNDNGDIQENGENVVADTPTGSKNCPGPTRRKVRCGFTTEDCSDSPIKKSNDLGESKLSEQVSIAGLNAKVKKLEAHVERLTRTKRCRRNDGREQYERHRYRHLHLQRNHFQNRRHHDRQHDRHHDRQHDRHHDRHLSYDTATATDCTTCEDSDGGYTDNEPRWVRLSSLATRFDRHDTRRIRRQRRAQLERRRRERDRNLLDPINDDESYI